MGATPDDRRTRRLWPLLGLASAAAAAAVLMPVGRWAKMIDGLGQGV